MLITVDALRYDEFKKRFGILEKTMERRYIFFENAFANGCGTSRSFLSIMCSSYPLAFGKQFHISKHEKTLAEALLERGYRTLGFVAANPFVSSVLGYNRGFIFFDDYMRFKGNAVPGKASWFFTTAKNLILGRPNYPRAEEILSDILQRLSTVDTDKPYFAWVHLMDTHLPWLPPSKNLLWKLKAMLFNIKFRSMLKEYKGKRDPNLIHSRVVREAKKLYIRSVDYLMNVLKEFVAEIDRKYPNTWIVILADHGEAFGEMGILSHPPELYDITLHIPVVIFPPKGILRENITVEDLFSLIDLSPTLLELFGLSPEPRFLGKARNVFEYKGDGFVYSEALEEDGSDKIDISEGHEVLSVRTGKYRFIFWEKGNVGKLYEEDRWGKEKEVNNNALKKEMRTTLLKLKNNHRRHAITVKIKSTFEE